MTKYIHELPDWPRFRWSMEVLAQRLADVRHWFNRDDGTDFVLRAGIAHLWFVTIHPFDDGNGRSASYSLKEPGLFISPGE